MCRPRLAVVSEFGEEMKAFRVPLIEGLQKNVIDRFFAKNKKPYVPRVVPGDLAFIYEINKREFYSCVEDGWEKVDDIGFRASGTGKSLKDGVYYYSTKNGEPNAEIFKDKVKLFNGRRDGKSGMYFV